MNENNKTKFIKLAATIALVGNAILAILKIIVGALTGSAALIGDGMDSTADVLISAVTLFVVRIISKPADAEHPWGHGRAETIATAFLSFIIFFMGAQLIFNSVLNLITEQQQIVPSTAAIIVTLISIVGKILLAWTQYILGKRADSAMVKVNAKNMANDVLISVGVLVGLAISSFTGAAYADTIIAILIGAWIIKTAIGIFLEANLELMDGSNDIEPYRVIVDSVNAVEGAANPHRARMRKIAGFWDINFDIDVSPELTVAEAHGIATQVEFEIKKRFDNIFDIMIHIEPTGDDETEAFGLSEDIMCGK